MLLIYTHQVTSRIKYTFNLIFKSILEIDFEITSDTEQFKRFEGAKLSYAKKQIANELFFENSGLLFETGIKKKSELTKDSFALAFFLVSRYEEYLPFTGDNYE